MKYKFAVAFAIAMLALVFSPQAQAVTITFCLSDVAPTSNGNCLGANSVLVHTDGVTTTIDSVAGSAAVTSASNTANSLTGVFRVGVFDLNVTTGIMNGASTNVLDLGFSSKTATGTTGLHKLWIELNANPYTSGFTGVSGSGSATNDGTVDIFTGCIEPSAGLGGWCGLSGNTILGSVTLAGSSVVGTFPGGAVGSPTGLGILLEIDATGQATSTGDLKLIPVPEPTSILLLGGVLLVSAGAIRRRMHKA